MDPFHNVTLSTFKIEKEKIILTKFCQNITSYVPFGQPLKVNDLAILVFSNYTWAFNFFFKWKINYFLFIIGMEMLSLF